MGEPVAVPQAAIDAAVPAFCNTETGSDYDDTRVILAAAAPHIAAAALREAAEELLRSSAAGLDYIKPTAAAWLRERADRLDGRQPSQDTRAGILAAAGLTEQDIERADG